MHYRALIGILTDAIMYKQYGNSTILLQYSDCSFDRIDGWCYNNKTGQILVGSNLIDIYRRMIYDWISDFKVICVCKPVRCVSKMDSCYLPPRNNCATVDV
jgi:hypothetical protein